MTTLDVVQSKVRAPRPATNGHAAEPALPAPDRRSEIDEGVEQFGPGSGRQQAVPRGPATALVPGALLMAIGADVLHLLTTYWIGHLIARKTSTYGPVGIALAVLLWVYILGRFIVASAGLNAALLYRRQKPVAARKAGAAPADQAEPDPGTQAS